jgi:inorganic pyrophosphatase
MEVRSTTANFVLPSSGESAGGFGSVEILIEVPKWSFVKRDGQGGVDFVSPLPCPFNYGFLPGAQAGDGASRDALVLGRRLGRGSRVRRAIVGRVRFVDAGLEDDKLVCSERPLGAWDRFRLRAFFSVYVLAKRLIHGLRRERGRTAFLGLSAD